MPALHLLALRRRLGPATLALSLVLLAACDSPEEKAQTYYQRGMSSLAAGKLDEAAIDLRNVLKLKENDTDALMALAQVEERRRNVDAAARIYASVAEHDPNHLDARVRLARFLLAAGQVDSAAVYAEQAIRIRPGDPRVLVIKAGIALRQDKRAEATRLAQEALRKDPRNATALMVLAAERVAASDPAGALHIIDQAVAGNEAELGLQLLRLRTLDAMGLKERMRELSLALSERFPDDAAVSDAVVKAYLDAGRKEDAERAARQFARRHPGDDAAQIRLAALVRQMRGAAAAADELKAATAALPEADEAKSVALGGALADMQEAAGQPDAALQTLQERAAAATSAGAHRAAQLQLARMLAKMKRWSAAAEVSDDILDNDPRNIEALTVRATSRLAMNDPAGAVRDLVTALAEDPNSVNLAALLADGYERMGSAALAEQQYERALTRGGYAPAAGVRLAQFLLRYGRSEKATHVLEDLRTHGTADAAALTLLARLRLDAHDWKGAEQIAGELRALDATGQGHFADQIMAAALNGMNRPGEGIDLLRSRLPQSADRDEAEAELIRAYIRAGRFADAEARLQERLRADPGNVPFRILLGSALAAAGRTAEAEAEFQAAVVRDSNGARADAALAQFYLRGGRLADAERAARAGLVRDGHNGALRLLIAQTLEARGDVDGAIAEYEVLMHTDPTSTVVANNLASLLSERADDPKALERAFAIASRFRNSDVPQFLDTLGWIHYLRGEYREAMPLLTRAAEKLPKNGAVQFHLGMVLKEAGNATLSAASLEKAVRLAPGQNAGYLETALATLQQIKSPTSTN